MTICRPGKMNAITGTLRSDFVAKMKELNANTDVRADRLPGDEQGFSSGQDLEEAKEFTRRQCLNGSKSSGLYSSQCEILISRAFSPSTAFASGPASDFTLRRLADLDAEEHLGPARSEGGIKPASQAPT